MQLIFGPVVSRRFGSSLGVDLSPQTKQCNFDCIYCELSPSATTIKQSYTVGVDEIINELKKHLQPNIDVITITANGEPTLYPYLDQLIDEIDNIKNGIKTLILTNSATLRDPKIFTTLQKLDKVKLSLDAVSPNIFKKIDRAEKSIDIQQIIKAIIEFSNIYNGELYIEILFVKGINDKDDEILKLNETLKKIKNICRVDLSTIDRPPAYNVQPISYERLFEISKLFDNTIPIYIASRASAKYLGFNYTKEEILNTLHKRPLTMTDIETLFNNESKDRFFTLLSENKIEKITKYNIEFYKSV